MCASAVNYYQTRTWFFYIAVINVINVINVYIAVINVVCVSDMNSLWEQHEKDEAMV